MRLAAALLLIGLTSLAPAFAAGEEDWDDLGVEAKGGNAAPAEAVSKAKVLDAKYERMKERLSGENADVQTEIATQQSWEGQSQDLAEDIAPLPEKAKLTGKDSLTLKNGQSLDHITIAEKTPKGWWIEMDGQRFFVADEEIAEMKRG